MSGNGFGRYLTEEYKAQTLRPEVAQRRAEDRAQRERARTMARQTEQVAADKAARNEAMARREEALLEIERCGNGFGRYLA